MKLQEAIDWAHRAEPAEIFIGNHPLRTQNALWALVEEVEKLGKELQQAKDMLFAVTAVCNGSSAMEHLDAFRNADTMLQEVEKEKFRAVLEQIALGQFTAHGCKEIASKSLAESV